MPILVRVTNFARRWLLVIVTAVLVAVWLASLFVAFSAAVAWGGDRNEIVVGAIRGRIALRYRMEIVPVVGTGVHFELLDEPTQWNDFLGECYYEHSNDPALGSPASHYVGLEIPFPFLILASVVCVQLVTANGQFRLRSLMIVVGIIAVLATWYL